jgi:hypothetical protein
MRDSNLYRQQQQDLSRQLMEMMRFTMEQQQRNADATNLGVGVVNELPAIIFSLNKDVLTKLRSQIISTTLSTSF